MKRIIKIVVFFFLLLSVFEVKALSNDYNDKLYDTVNVKKEENKVNIYFFYGNTCPHCKSEKEFLNKITKKYGNDVNIYYYETYDDSSNLVLMFKSKIIMGKDPSQAVPFLVMGEKSYLGYNRQAGEKIERDLLIYLEKNDSKTNDKDKDKEYIPILGNVNIKEVSIVVIAIILGFIDGFNPCAMWVLLFLINMLIGMKNKKKMVILGFTFLIASSFCYGLSMFGIGTFLDYLSAPLIRKFIGLLALFFGFYNLYKYFKTRKEEVSCEVIDDNKRKKMFTRIRKFTEENNLFLALLGVIVLAFSVNVVELACSTVFPAMFLEILSVNSIIGMEKILYILLYVLFYMIDDLVVFLIAVFTLKLSGTSNKYNKYFKLLSGIIMFLVGFLLILKPEWIMLNF